MKKCHWAIVAVLFFAPVVRAGKASGSYQESGGRFAIGYAIAERDAATGEVRVLLTRETPPNTPDRDHHLKRLEAMGEAADGGYMILEPTSSGDGFNISMHIDEIGGGGGGQYPSQIQIGAKQVGGKIETEVLSGQLSLTFEAEYLEDRQVRGDLPADGGEPGAALLAQMKAVASGDRDLILATLSQEQRDQFNQLSAEEQEEAVSSTVEFAPKNVRITGGVLYDGYAIVTLDAEQFGESVTGTALVSQDGDRWLVREVSMVTP